MKKTCDISAIEVFADIYDILPEYAAKDWLTDCRAISQDTIDTLSDPWVDDASAGALLTANKEISNI